MADERATVQAVALNPWMPEQDPIRLAVLGKLLEELGEASAIVARCVIQGVEESEPVTGKPNREALQNELADVLAMVDIAVRHLGLDDMLAMSRRIADKDQHIQRWHKLIRERFRREGEELV